MSQLLSYLHKFWWTLLAAILCICSQVFFELQLPGFMSALVSTGIQCRGIEHAAPAALTEADAELVTSFMTPPELTLFDQSYAAEDGTFHLTEVSEDTLAQLDRAFTVSEWTVLRLMAALPAGREIGGAAASQTMPDLSDVNLNTIRQSAGQLRRLPTVSVAAARHRAAAIPEQLALQTGAAFAAAFDEAAGADPAAIQRTYMLRTGGRMALCAGVAALFSILVNLTAARTGAGLARNLRRAIFVRVQSFSRADFDHFTNASLLARTTSDVTLVQSAAIAAIRIVVFAFCMGSGGIVLAAFSSPVLAWILAAAVAAVSAVILSIFRITRPRYRIVQDMIDRLNLVAQEDVEGASTIRVFGGEKHEEERFDQANDRLATTQLGINRVLIFLSPAFGLAANLVSLAIVGLGADAVQRSALEIGNIVADIQYAGIVLTAFTLVAGMFVIVPRAAVSAERIGAVLGWTPDFRETETAGREAGPRADVVAERAGYAYPRSPRRVLKDISFTARSGQVTALVGLTGSGKTALLDLLSGARSPDSGSIQVGGLDLGHLPRSELDRLIAYLPQDRRLLIPRQTGKSFIGAGLDAGAAQAVRIKDLSAEALRNDLLCRRALVYLLDEPFQGVRGADYTALWQQVRAAARQGAVVLATAHVSHARLADHIVLLSGGAMAAQGTHSELMRTSELYRRLAEAEGEREDA